MTEPTIEQMRAAWEKEQKAKAKKAAYQVAYYQRPEVKAKQAAYQAAYQASLRRLAKLARDAGLG